LLTYFSIHDIYAKRLTDTLGQSDQNDPMKKMRAGRFLDHCLYFWMGQI